MGGTYEEREGQRTLSVLLLQQDGLQRESVAEKLTLGSSAEMLQLAERYESVIYMSTTQG